ncbi:MAG: hypothetical protein K0S01_2090 [Herbinix sp.]|jgi:type II secretory pathway pseudopilin PulG|nr:hypothetical protein [Herbinix sp.]
MKKITQSQLELIILLLIITIAAAAYRFGYTEYHTKAESIKVENRQLNLRLAELEQKMAKKESMEKGTVDAKEQQETIYAKYGTGNTPQKSIMMVRDMEEQTQMIVNNITFAPETGIYFSAKLKEDGTSAVSLYTTQLSLNFETGYEGLKTGMNFINSYPERMNVESFNVVYNQETGLLNGAMVLNLYSIVRENSFYKEPDVSGIGIGADNIFGTYTPTVDNP